MQKLSIGILGILTCTAGLSADGFSALENDLTAGHDQSPRNPALPGRGRAASYFEAQAPSEDDSDNDDDSNSNSDQDDDEKASKDIAPRQEAQIEDQQYDDDETQKIIPQPDAGNSKKPAPSVRQGKNNS